MTVDAPAAGGGAGSSSNGGGGKGGQSLVNFDPTGLERAAKAAKELDSSKNSKGAIDIALSQERTQQLESEAKLKEREVMIKQLEMQRARVEEEERRKTIEMETTHINHRNKAQDEMARRRNQEQMEGQKRLQDEQLRRQEDSIQKQEAMKRQTVEYEKELQRKNDKAKVDAEIEGKIKYERENRLLHVENMKLQAAEMRDTTIEAIKVAGETIGKGVREFLGDREKLTAAVASVTLLALGTPDLSSPVKHRTRLIVTVFASFFYLVGVYAARTSTSVIGKYVESRMGKPSLVRETSRRTVTTALREPLKSKKHPFWIFVICQPSPSYRTPPLNR